MTIYSNELAPWERKNEYLCHVALGKDVKSQLLSLQKAIDEQTLARFTSANEIIASRERISEGLGELSVTMSRLEQGFENLRSYFEWGISDVVWQIELNKENMKKTLEDLSHCYDTKTKERRKIADYQYSIGQIDDAERQYNELKKLNKTDFTIDLSLGVIYIFHKIDKIRALSYLDEAIRHTPPKYKQYIVYAMLFKALIMRDFGRLEEAIKNTASAISLYPSYSEAIYQNAQYNALQGKKELAINSLKKAIEIDVAYCLKADASEEFAGMRDEVVHLLQDIQQKEWKKAYREWEKLRNQLMFICNLSFDVGKIYGADRIASNCIRGELKKEMSKIKILINRKSILDSQNAIFKLYTVQQKILTIVSQFI